MIPICCYWVFGDSFTYNVEELRSRRLFIDLSLAAIGIKLSSNSVKHVGRHTVRHTQTHRPRTAIELYFLADLLQIRLLTLLCFKLWRPCSERSVRSWWTKNPSFIDSCNAFRADRTCSVKARSVAVLTISQLMNIRAENCSLDFGREMILHQLVLASSNYCLWKVQVRLNETEIICEIIAKFATPPWLLMILRFHISQIIGSKTSTYLSKKQLSQLLQSANTWEYAGPANKPGQIHYHRKKS